MRTRMGVLARHEAQHHARFVDKWDGLERDLERMSDPVTERDVQDRCSTFDSDVNTAQRDYDRTSRNGQKAGVRLDPPS